MKVRKQHAVLLELVVGFSRELDPYRGPVSQIKQASNPHRYRVVVIVSREVVSK